MAPGGDALATKAVRFGSAPCWHPSFCILAGTAALPPTNSERPRFRPCASNGARLSISSEPRSAPSRRSRPPSRSPASGGSPAFDPRRTPALVQLNAVTSPIFNGIGRSPVPVLLPFDTAALLDARAERRAGQPAGVALSGRLPHRPVRRRACRLRRDVFARTRRRRRPAASGPSPSPSKCRSPARS